MNHFRLIKAGEEFYIVEGIPNGFHFKDEGITYIGVFYHVYYKHYNDYNSYLVILEYNPTPVYVDSIDNTNNNSVARLSTISICNYVCGKKCTPISKCTKLLTPFEYEMMKTDLSNSEIVRILDLTNLLECIYRPGYILCEYMKLSGIIFPSNANALRPDNYRIELGTKPNMPQPNINIIDILFTEFEREFIYEKFRNKAFLKVRKTEDVSLEYYCTSRTILHHLNSITLGEFNTLTLVMGFDTEGIIEQLANTIKRTEAALM